MFRGISIPAFVLAVMIAPGLIEGQAGAPYAGPIIDMHMHASWQLGDDGRPLPLMLNCYPGPCEVQPGTAVTEGEVLRRTLDQMDRHHIVLGFLSGFDGSPTDLVSNMERVRVWSREAPGRFLRSVFVGAPGNPTAERLRSEYADGTLQGLGEIATQYYGYRPKRSLKNAL